MVSPEGIEPAGGRRTGRVPDDFWAKTLRPTGGVVSRIFASWNQLEGWLRQVEVLRTAA